MEMQFHSLGKTKDIPVGEKRLQTGPQRHSETWRSKPSQQRPNWLQCSPVAVSYFVYVNWSSVWSNQKEDSDFIMTAQALEEIRVCDLWGESWGSAFLFFLFSFPCGKDRLRKKYPMDYHVSLETHNWNASEPKWTKCQVCICLITVSRLFPPLHTAFTLML